MNKTMDIYGSESKVAGFLHQAAMEAAQKKFKELSNKSGEDAAYWDICLELELKTLSIEDFSPMRSVIVKNKIYE